MSEFKVQRLRKQKRLRRTRKHVMTGSKRPRLSVARSNKHFYAQIIDDKNGKTMVSIHEKEISKVDTMTKSQKAEALGKMLAQKAQGLKVSQVVFDKGAYRYHGRVKAFAEAAREGGLKF